jgi:hypothetical protein
MTGNEFQKASILLLLSQNLIACGGRVGADPEGITPQHRPSLALRGRDYEDLEPSHATRIHREKKGISLLRRAEEDSDEDDSFEIVDDNVEEEPALEHDPNREFSNHDHVAKEDYVEAFNTGHIISTTASYEGTSQVRQSRNQTNENVTIVDEMEDIGEPSVTSGDAVNQTLQKNTQDALFRHVDLPQENDVASDNIYLPRPHNDNVFETRQHDQG